MKQQILSTDLQPKQRTKLFQIRWKEKLGDQEHPYAIRYVFIFFGYALRIHIWKCSDGPTTSGYKYFYSNFLIFTVFKYKNLNVYQTINQTKTN